VSRAADDAAETPHPRETAILFGHADAERTLLDAYRGGRMPHAFILGGPPGIGKATLAYRVARFVLAYPDPDAAETQTARSLALEEAHPVARSVAARSHPDLLTLERTIGPTGTMRTMISVDEVRRTVSFFGSTAGAGGWRVCIVDSADELQLPNAANALLKMLEEPPARSLFLLVSHAPGRLLPTIRSRSRRLALRPLDPADVARAAAHALGRNEDDEVRQAAAAGEGSVARALTLLGGPALVVRDKVMALLAALPATDPRALHELGDLLARADGRVFATFVDTIQSWLAARLGLGPMEPRRLAPWAEVWEKLDRAARDVEVFNLDRKPMVFSVFGLLAETAGR
jgi:DNA polymerase-3 subunit delta'